MFAKIGIEITRNPLYQKTNLYDIVDDICIKSWTETNTIKKVLIGALHVDCGVLEFRTLPTKKLSDLKIQWDHINSICKGYPVTKNRTHTGGGHIHVELKGEYAQLVLYIYEWLCNRPWFSWSLLDSNDIHNATYNYIEARQPFNNIFFHEAIKIGIDTGDSDVMQTLINWFDKDSIIRVKNHYQSFNKTLEFRFFQTPKSYIEITKNIALLEKIFKVNSKRAIKHDTFKIKYNKKRDLNSITLKESLSSLRSDLISLGLNPKTYSFMFNTLKERYARGKHYLV